MAGILGLDLDATEMRLVELQSSGGSYQLHAALALPTGAADPAKLGAELKARLAAVGFKANSVVVALSHDAMTCREVRHPDIPAGELPAIVQFQVLKESSVPPDDAIVDYVPLTQPLSNGERRSLTYAVRKGRVQYCEKLCEAAGLKLLGVIPRAVALLATITKAKLEPGAIGYACSNSFFVVNNGELIFNRSMGAPADLDELLAELRRSIAGYENQANMPTLDHVCLGGHELPEEAQKQLGTFRVPVSLYDPYLGIVGAERLIGHGDYAVACGAAQAAKAFKKFPVEFLNPKKVVVKPNRSRSYALIGGVAAASLAFLVWGVYWMLTSSIDEEITKLQDSIKDKQRIEKGFIDTDVQKRYEAIKTWKEHEVFVLEELYDLIETFPDVAGVQVVKAEWKTNETTTRGPVLQQPPAASKTTGPVGTNTAAVPKNIPIKPIARFTVKATAEQEDQLKTLQTALKNSKHWTWVKSESVPNERNTMVFELDVVPLKPEEYRSVITVGANITSTDGSSTNRPGTRRGFRPAGGGRP